MARLAQTRPCIVIFCNICRNTDRMGSTDRYRTVHLIIIHSQISAALNNSDQNFRDDPGINYTIRQDLVERFQERRISRRSGAATASCQLSRAEHSSPPHNESVVATVLAVPPAARRAAKTPHEIRAAFYTRRSQ
jgi:hypothetical protein